MKELILIRHGKAEKRGSVFPDRNRKLVIKGINQLNKDIPFLGHYLKNKQVVYLWSSGMIRTMETAGIIKKICKIDEIETCGFIETGDFDAFKQKADQIEDECTIIIVGHEPDISEWTYRLCKKNVRIKKGCALLIEISSDQRSGTMRWIAEPGEYQDIIV
ncbi:histidine phosphatase family protein [Acetobacterium sp.]|uniref:SixA phosphatase family protein n=1 Tax=Acetobacterium sp. TaxID=1872094 RepID=UPI00359359F7